MENKAFDAFQNGNLLKLLRGDYPYNYLEIITHKEIVDYMEGRVDKAQTRYDNHPSPKNRERLKRAQMDLENAKSDGELLIKGTVPAEYIR